MSGVLFQRTNTVLSIRILLHVLLAVSALLAGPVGLHLLSEKNLLQTTEASVNKKQKEGRTFFYLLTDLLLPLRA